MHVSKCPRTYTSSGTYISFLISQIPEAEWLYAAVAVPALLDPALDISAVVVVAAPRSTSNPICGMRLSGGHGETRDSIYEIVAIPLRLEQLCQLVSREATFCRAAVTSRLCVRWDVRPGI
jgi:hypothetical protein